MTRINQKGVALLSALLILAICTSLSVALLISQKKFISEVRLGLESDRLQRMLEGVEEWGCERVLRMKIGEKNPTFNRTLKGIKIEGTLYPLQGRFNLNSLTDPDNLPHFLKILQSVDRKITPAKARSIAVDVFDYVSEESTSPKGEHFPHQPMVSLSELRRLPSVSADLYSKLVLGEKPVLVALPSSESQLDINSTTAFSLVSVEGVNFEEAVQLIKCRERMGPIKRIDYFIQACAPDLPFLKNCLITKSQYYLLKGQASKGNQSLTLQAVLEVVNEKGKWKVNLVWQEFNGE